MATDAVIHLIDDDDGVRQSLAFSLTTAGLAVRAYPSAVAFLKALPDVQPGCVVTDVRMPGIDGLELQRRLNDQALNLPVIVMTGHADVRLAVEAMKAGAIDFLTKPVDDEDLLAAVQRALARSAEVRTAATQRAAARRLLDTLTPREFEVMRRVIAGTLNKQIADELGAAEKTIKIHRGRVMEKMRATSVAELVRVAQVAGVTPAAAA